MQIVQKKGEPSPNNLAWGTADIWGKNFCSCRSEATDGGPELRETKAPSTCVVTVGSLCVCVCVRAREREREKETEREKRRRGHRDLISEWMVTGFWGLSPSLPPTPRTQRGCQRRWGWLCEWLLRRCFKVAWITRGTLCGCVPGQARERESYVV